MKRPRQPRTGFQEGKMKPLQQILDEADQQKMAIGHFLRKSLL